jgi:hypothetical protein
MTTATKAFALAGLAGSAAAFSGLAPAGLKPSNGRLANQRLQLRNARPSKVLLLLQPLPSQARPRACGARARRMRASTLGTCENTWQ